MPRFSKRALLLREYETEVSQRKDAARYQYYMGVIRDRYELDMDEIWQSNFLEVTPKSRYAYLRASRATLQ
jgi:hypothetical protein